MLSVDRRKFLQTVGAASMVTALPESAFGAGRERRGGAHVLHEVAEGQEVGPLVPKGTVKFSVCGMSHDHIYGMVGAMQRGGAELVSVYAQEPERGDTFEKRFPGVKRARSVEEVLHDPSIQLVLSSAVPNQRAKIGIAAMRAGKDFLSDKPGALTLEDLEQIRKTVAETKKIYAIMYSELLEVKAAVKAGELVHAGAIGKVIQTINIAPHQITQKPGGDAGISGGRPAWFWEPDQGGGILADIGSHQVEQFLFYTGSTKAEVVASQVANVRHPQHPRFQDFGDMMLHGDKGFGYVRLDWFTPGGLGTWGDGRLFMLGTDGYIELRKYVDIAGRKGGNHLFIVDAQGQRYIDCSNVALPFGPQFVADVANRTHKAQDQTQALLTAELVIRAQMAAKHQSIV